METEHTSRSSSRDGLLLRILILVFLITSCWIFGNPRSSGPDEPSHMVTSAGVVRGEFDGETVPENPALEIFEVPGMVGMPDPVCWAQQPGVPVACAGDQPLDAAETPRATTSSNYAPWAFVLPGLASFAPWGGGYAYLARILNSLVPIALVGCALTVLTRERPTGGAAAMFGLTPIVWFTFGTVNPSAVAIAGGFALWAGLIAGRPSPGRSSPSRSSPGRLIVLGGWIALMLARRDGPLWATAIVIASCAVLSVRPFALWNRLERWERWTIVATVPLAMVPALLDGAFGFELLLAAAPIAVLGLDVAMQWWARHPDRSARVGFLTAIGLAAAWGTAVALVLRPGGFQAELVRLVAAQTGQHLIQIVGVLGWLDAPVPTSGVLLYWAGIGALAAVAWLEAPRLAIICGLAIVFTIVAAWVLELGQGANYGQYWQGRYSMPFAVGFPIVLSFRLPGLASIDRLCVQIAAAAWLMGNLGFFAAQRRWGVGVDGSWYPWDWDTWGAPVPPVVLLGAHAATSAMLATTIVRHGRDRRAGADTVVAATGTSRTMS